MSDIISNHDMVEEAKAYRQKRRTYWLATGGVLCSGGSCFFAFLTLCVASGVSIGFKSMFGWSFAQKAIGASSITINDWNIHSFSADDESLKCDLNAIINIRAPMAVESKSMIVAMEYEGTEFASFTQPLMTMSAGTTALQLKDIDVDVKNSAQFKRLFGDLMKKDTVMVHLVGHISINMGKFSFSDIPMRVNSTLTGFPVKMKADKFMFAELNNGFPVLSFDLNFESAGSVSLPVGKLAGDISFKHNDKLVKIGRAASISDAVFLKLGTNRIPMKTTIEVDEKNAAEMEAYQQLVAEYVNGIAVQLHFAAKQDGDSIIASIVNGLQADIAVSRIEASRRLIHDGGFPMNWKDCTSFSCPAGKLVYPFAKDACDGISTDKFAVTGGEGAAPPAGSPNTVVDSASLVIQNPFDIAIKLEHVDFRMIWLGGPQPNCLMTQAIDYAVMRKQIDLDLQKAERTILPIDMCFLDNFAENVYEKLVNCLLDVTKSDPTWPVIQNFMYAGSVRMCLDKNCMDIPINQISSTMSTFRMLKKK